MNVWMLTDDAGRVLALNPNDMTGNSGWSGTTEEALGLAADADLHDAHGAALYELQDGAAVLRDEAARQADWMVEEAPAPASDDIPGRVSVLEEDTATLTDAVNILLGVDGNA